jgi:SH3-like domain-containing protein
MLMRDAAELLRKMEHERLVDAENHRAWVKMAQRDAVREGFEAGYKDGYQRGVEVALNRLEPDHAATVRVFQQRRIDEVKEGNRSVRSASAEMGWVDEDVQIAAFGEIRQ